MAKFIIISIYAMLKKIIKLLLNPKKWIETRTKIAIHQYQVESLRKSLGSCGEGVSILMPTRIEGPENVKIGNRVSIVAFVHIWGNGGVEIGDDTLIASHVAITSLTHSSDANLFADSIIAKPVIIGRNVWIGSHAVILPGVSIGDNAIIGAGAVVTEDVHANTIVVGVPAKPIKHRLETNISTIK